MIDAFNITQDRISRSRLAGDPPDVMIGPKLGRVGLFDFHRADETIELGRQAARAGARRDRRRRRQPTMSRQSDGGALTPVAQAIAI